MCWLIEIHCDVVKKQNYKKVFVQQIIDLTVSVLSKITSPQKMNPLEAQTSHRPADLTDNAFKNVCVTAMSLTRHQTTNDTQFTLKNKIRLR